MADRILFTTSSGAVSPEPKILQHISHVRTGRWASSEAGQIAPHASCHSLKLYAQDRHGSDACMGYGLRFREERIHNGILHVSFSKFHLFRLGSQHEFKFRRVQLLTKLSGSIIEFSYTEQKFIFVALNFVPILLSWRSTPNQILLRLRQQLQPQLYHLQAHSRLIPLRGADMSKISSISG